VLQARQESQVGVADGQALEVIVIGRHHVKQVEIPVAIEDGFAIPAPLMTIGFSGVPL
jgi:hypothetical protein